MEIQSGAGLDVMAQSISKETFGAQLVTKTIDNMNTNNKFSGSGSTDADYDFQKSVLTGAYMGESSIINKLV